MERVAGSGIGVPNVVKTREGAELVDVRGKNGVVYPARLLTFVDGVPLATARPRSRRLLATVGSMVGRLSQALDGFDHPAFERDLIWDMRHAGQTVADRLEYVDADERRLLEPFVARFHDAMKRRGSRLRRSVVHHDLNDHNVLIDEPDRWERGGCGIIDFGDMVASYTVTELAVAVAYGILDARDPLRAASTLVARYCDVFPLREDEVSVLFPMIGMRLCVSVAISSQQRTLEPDDDYPDDDYLTVSRAPALRMLERLAAIPARLAEYVFRRDAGFEPCPRGKEVARWCRLHRSEAAPVVRPAPTEEVTCVLDFSTRSTWTFEELTEPASGGRAVRRHLERAGVPTGVGRYGEVRLVYRGEQFTGDSQTRTVHLGIDLFQPAGSKVYAPLDAEIYALADNDRSYDYGPTVILKHAPVGGPTFYTLYGHLDRDTLVRLKTGDRVRAGEDFARVGRRDENGGWVPHVHVQIVADLMDGSGDRSGSVPGSESVADDAPGVRPVRPPGDFPGACEPWMAEVWKGISPSPVDLLGLAEGAAASTSPDAASLLEARGRNLAPSLSVSYRAPVPVHRGFMTRLYDRDGQAYLDTVNNVAHVGHAHPRVVEAVSKQLRVLNTNTRYLYEELHRFAERLTATLPDALDACFFVNSGSEANDLALRLARSHTRRTDVLVHQHAYHGNLSSLIEISPYKFAGEGGAGRRPHVHVAPMPDPYRSDASGAAHAEALRRAAGKASDGLAAFVAESAMGCGGQVFYPDGYLAAAYRHARRAGAACIADEVQTGFGRVGEAFWAFELQDVVPDIVTMGKPIGNGHPLGAVVTTRAIAASFDSGMEYFNTFGGNPVSCAAGLAVLDVIREDGLREHALRIGRRFKSSLHELAADHDVIGDVRGTGLFLGIELVRDRHAKAPAGMAADYVVNRMREEGILTSRDGPHGNVIKIKPPLVIGGTDVDRYAATLDEILREDFVRTG